ncbi:hypothetical protein, partial [Halalkalibacterium halodurans]|uniref:hypothetical protein n=1 Tax=Halalkalibacterium halodurans TaxID=86665 RepID=UPI001FBACF1C
DTITVVGLGVTGKSFFVYAQKFSAGLCIFPLQSSALLFCHTHEKSWLAWVALIFCAPVGIFLMWKYKHHGKVLRSVASVLFAIIWLNVVFGGSDDVAKEEDSTEVAAVEEEEDIEEENEEEIEDKDEEPEKEEPEKEEPEKEEKEEQEKKEKKEESRSPEEIIENVITDTLKEKTNYDAERIAEISVINTDEGDFLQLTLNGNDNLTAGFIKTGIYRDTLDLLKEFDQLDSVDVNNVMFSWQVPLVDAYGNEDLGEVMRINLSGETLSKINFDNFNYDNFPIVSDEYWEHPVFE